MNYISVEQVGKSFGNLELFSNISFGINEGQKIGLIAKNGSGKTTLMNMLMGIEPCDEGNIVFKNNLNTAFLPQRPQLDDNATVKETIFADDNPQLKAIRAYEKAMENPEDADAYQAAFDQMEATQAWDFETDYQQILSKLQLHFLDQKVKHLSGGQQKRLALAQVLLKNPEMLIVDEPTNHLDLDMIEWLEEYFSKANLTLFMVTHDRYFCNVFVIRYWNLIRASCIPITAIIIITYKNGKSESPSSKKPQKKPSSSINKSLNGCANNPKPERPNLNRG